jgi:hypothetical protein
MAAPLATAPTTDRLLIHRFGVNYTPAERWWYCWNDFDADAIAHDFDAIAALGMDHLRIMLIWPWFQPNAAYVSPAHLDRLGQLMDLAAARKLDVCVSVFTGWLSGFAFKPPFYSADHFYTSERFRGAQHLFVDRLAERLRDRPNFLGFDLGNEMNCCWSAPSADGDAWMAALLTAMNHGCPGRTHVNGVDHQPWFGPSTFSPQALCRAQSIVPLHAYILFTGALKHGRPMEAPCVRLAAGMAALARSYAGDASKPIWLQEYGASPDWMPAADVPRFLTAATLAGIEEGISWFTWWCSHDIRRSMEFPPVEYELGLLTVDQKVKPAGAAMREIAAAYRGKPARPRRGTLRPVPTATMDDTWRWLLEWMSP